MHHDLPDGPCACTTLRKAARAVGRVYDEALADNGMTTAQFAILRHVSRGEPLPLSRLADSLMMDRTSLYRAIAPIEARGWVTVVAGPGKAKLASLTPEGRVAMEGAEADWGAVQQRIVGAMGAEQWAGLQASLRTLTDLAQHA
ncbi:MarR family winged helix-turn-helix transcriptional regulator [Sphingomonas sp. AOB5]|uniref:MarR family winged helix-turn-helix transcriptional regulator n=1 Tax=Sphingomonas sp. AOB5 TaxID=3034017 RepID=UPI0023F6DF66|nr:MarR family winged helix-turn-helix transcriptional regulator [Sphingomonas sp. AOB5]MDF7774684.1 MarR family winged helix-turn-helix transcriptional regulator [Sphingomonas sp. AOB5]